MIVLVSLRLWHIHYLSERGGHQQVRYTLTTTHVLTSVVPFFDISCGGFTVDGNCNRLLRLPLDGCNTKGENGKQVRLSTEWQSCTIVIIYTVVSM